MATILVTHGIPAEGFSLLSGEKIVIPKPLMQFSQDIANRHKDTSMTRLKPYSSIP